MINNIEIDSEEFENSFDENQFDENQFDSDSDSYSEIDNLLKNIDIESEIKQIEKEARQDSREKLNSNWNRNLDKFEKIKAEKLLALCKRNEKVFKKPIIKLPQGYSPTNHRAKLDISKLDSYLIKSNIDEYLLIDKFEKKGINFDMTLEALKNKISIKELKEIFFDECKKNKIPAKM